MSDGMRPSARHLSRAFTERAFRLGGFLKEAAERRLGFGMPNLRLTYSRLIAVLSHTEHFDTGNLTELVGRRASLKCRFSYHTSSLPGSPAKNSLI